MITTPLTSLRFIWALENRTEESRPGMGRADWRSCDSLVIISETQVLGSCADVAVDGCRCAGSARTRPRPSSRFYHKSSLWQEPRFKARNSRKANLRLLFVIAHFM